MSIKFSFYDYSQDPQIDKVWYDSSNVIYSELIDSNTPEKELKIVFGKGQTYVYHKVNITDYVLFKNAESNGQAFHKYIKKYDNEMLDNTDLEVVKQEMEELIKMQIPTEKEAEVEESITPIDVPVEETNPPLDVPTIYQVSEKMLKVSNVKVYDIKESIIASRNAMRINEPEYTKEEFEISFERAKKLTSTLTNSGHSNFLSGINVSFDVLYPNYWSPEFQRYHFAQIVTSSSKMHRLSKMDFKVSCNKYVTEKTITYMEELIEQYNNDSTYENFMIMLSNCPLGIMLFMRINTNYLQLKNIYQQRKNHKLKEDWGAICMMIEGLPYFEEFIKC